jgi:hypothetical protein
MQDRVPQDLDLSSPAVARVHLDAPIARVQHRPLVSCAGERRTGGPPIRPNVGLEVREKRARPVLYGVMMIGEVGRPENQLHLPRVLPPRREQPVRRHCRGRVLPPPDNRHTPLRHPLPQRGRRVEHEHMHVAPDRQRPQHIEMPRRQPRQPKERQPRRQIDDPRLLAQARTSALHPLRLIRNLDSFAQPPPELRLPHPVRRHGAVLPASPCTNHLRPMQRIPIEQLRKMPDRSEPPSPPRGIPLLLCSTEMRRQARQPGLPETSIHHLEQSPNRPLRQPGIRIRPDPRRRRHRIPNEPPRRREFDIRADPIAPPIPCPKPIRHPLREPPLHAPRGHGDNLRGERIGQRLAQQRAERLDKAVGPLSSMNMQHVWKS